MEDMDTFLVRGQDEIRALIFTSPTAAATTTTTTISTPTVHTAERQLVSQPPPPPPATVDWKLVMERAHELERQEKALLAAIELKAERRRQRYDQGQRRRRRSDNSKTCYDRIVSAIKEPPDEPSKCSQGGGGSRMVRSSASSKNNDKTKNTLLCDEMHMGLLPNKYNKETSEMGGSDRSLTDWSSSVDDPSPLAGGLANNDGSTTPGRKRRTWTRFSSTSPPAANDSTVTGAYESKYSTLSEF